LPTVDALSQQPTLVSGDSIDLKCPLLENAAIALQQGHVAMGQ
jgi:hypothetical protein